jgi:branched-chain amino acid transport system ATP-binding protein
MGIMPVSSGLIELDGQNLTQVPGHRRARLGIGYMPEERRLIGAHSVQDNLLMPAWATGRHDENERLDYIYTLIPDLKTWADNKATQLSGGQQKLVALGRALMNGTKLLLLDEPFEGLAPALGQKLGEIIQGIRHEGLAILIAESDDKRLDFVEEMHTIERGEILQDGDRGPEGQ